MRALVVVGVAFAACTPVAPAGFEEMVYANAHVEVRLSQRDCGNVPLATLLLAAGGLTPPKAATVNRGLVGIAACWALDADTDVLIGDTAGFLAYFPIAAFHPAAAARHDQAGTGGRELRNERAAGDV